MYLLACQSPSTSMPPSLWQFYFILQHFLLDPAFLDNSVFFWWSGVGFGFDLYGNTFFPPLAFYSLKFLLFFSSSHSWPFCLCNPPPFLMSISLLTVLPTTASTLKPMLTPPTCASLLIRHHERDSSAASPLSLAPLPGTPAAIPPRGCVWGQGRGKAEQTGLDACARGKAEPSCSAASFCFGFCDQLHVKNVQARWCTDGLGCCKWSLRWRPGTHNRIKQQRSITLMEGTWVYYRWSRRCFIRGRECQRLGFQAWQWQINLMMKEQIHSHGAPEETEGDRGQPPAKSP